MEEKDCAVGNNTATAETDGKPREPGTALIKPEFIVHEHKMTLSKYLPQHISEQIAVKSVTQEEKSKEPISNDAAEEGPPSKKAKLKGRFKKRPREKRLLFENKVCPAVVREEACSYGEKCRFSHDVKKYLEDNPPCDGECYVYSTFGKCPFGVACMYSRQHVDADYKNVKNEDLVKKYDSLPPRVTNAISRDVSRLLSRRQYDFRLSDNIVKRLKNGGTVRSLDTCLNTDKAKETAADTNPSIDLNAEETCRPLNESSAARKSTASSDVKDSSKSDAVEMNSLSSINDNCTNGNDLKSNSVESNVVCQSTDAQPGDETMKVTSGTPTNVLDSEGIRLRPQEKTKIDFRDKLYLAPLTTVGNLPFRRICKEFGADITCSEMATCTGLLQGSMSEWALMKRHHTEDIFGAQICGAFPDTMTRCSQVLMENTDVDFIDVNMGCPIDLFFKKGEGCALMGKASKLETILSAMKAVMHVPLTVKMRTGIFEDKPIAHKLMQRVKDVGVSLVTIHGRSREQRYTRLADWQYINQCCNMADSLPVFGCGDVLSYDDYNQRREQTGVAGCMIARGALIKPWVFTEIKEARNWDISSTERFDMLKKFANYGLEHWGSDVQGVANTRKFLLEWLSFLHRYIPVGLLERPPQRINEKPPRFVGRNDLETLMASRNCGDWVKISEMLLGPVPNGFEFVPKHKANAYS